MRGFAVVVVGLVAGCYNPTPTPGAPCSTNNECPSGLECRNGICELQGGPSDDAPVDVAIDACPTNACSGNDLVGCGVMVTCEFGCSADGSAPHCRTLAPSNGLSPALLAGATASIVGDRWDFDTENGGIKAGNIILRPDGKGVIGGIGFEVIDGMGVFTANSFTLGEGEDWGAAGPNGVVLYATTSIEIAGLIDVGAELTLGGPGGSNGTTSQTGSNCRGRAGRALAAGFGEGGGGGGGATAGAAGAPSNQSGATGLGGVSCTTLVTTRPLRGGTGGGAGAGSTINQGGGGGGAIALVAMQSITVTGTIGSPGGGGVSSSTGDGGGGGGSGGVVLIEAPMVSITGQLTANGGGGAAPNTGDGNRGAMTSATVAAGGTYACPVVGTRRGGSGAAGAVAPTVGQNCQTDDGLGTITSSRGAGGGGAAGRIELRATTLTTTGALLSPPATSSTPDYQ